MNASDEAKAQRRFEELLAKGETITLEEVKKTMAERDKNDSTRKIAPAVPAPDAIMLDNSDSLEKTLETAINIIMEKIK
jgi:cytidylate kinase